MDIINLEEQKKNLEIRYPIGAKIKLTKLCNPEPHLPIGTIGTVIGYDDQPAVFVNWENGSSLKFMPLDGDKCQIID